MKESPAAFVFPSRSDPLAREIPDVSIPLARNENSGMTTGGLCLFRGRLRERECEAELRGTHSQAELGNDIGLMGALLPFVLRVVAGACVGRWTGQPTAAAGGAAARGVRGDWGILLRLDWEPLRERTLDHGSGQTRMPPQSDGTRGFWFRGIVSHARE